MRERRILMRAAQRWRRSEIGKSALYDPHWVDDPVQEAFYRIARTHDQLDGHVASVADIIESAARSTP